jgi:hypothetical protein
MFQRKISPPPLGYSLTLKMEVVCSSKMSVNSQWLYGIYHQPSSHCSATSVTAPCFMMILTLHCHYLLITSWMSLRSPSAPRCWMACIWEGKEWLLGVGKRKFIAYNQDKVFSGENIWVSQSTQVLVEMSSNLMYIWHCSVRTGRNLCKQLCMTTIKILRKGLYIVYFKF